MIAFSSLVYKICISIFKNTPSSWLEMLTNILCTSSDFISYKRNRKDENKYGCEIFNLGFRLHVASRALQA